MSCRLVMYYCLVFCPVNNLIIDLKMQLHSHVSITCGQKRFSSIMHTAYHVPEMAKQKKKKINKTCAKQWKKTMAGTTIDYITKSTISFFSCNVENHWKRGRNMIHVLCKLTTMQLSTCHQASFCQVQGIQLIILHGAPAAI